MNFYLYPFLGIWGKSTFSLKQSKDTTQHKPQHYSRHLSNVLMRLNIVLLLLGILLSQANARSLAQEITLSRKNTALFEVLKDIEKQSGYTFFYNKNDINANKRINLAVHKMPLRTVLEDILKQENLTYDFFDKTIVIKKNPSVANGSMKPHGSIQEIKPATQVQLMVRGTIVDEEGNGIVGASIRLKSDARKASSSGEKGEFVLPITSLNEILVISFLGYETREVKASLDRSKMNIVLSKRENTVDEVVVTGMMTFKKESFSGASSVYKQEELKQVANTNVVQAIKSLDPSFLVMENNLSGANPNILPNIELRGTTSISSDNLRDEFTDDPNQPLFILDGFQTKLRNILDLDMNRIASITILKDASSTAIYGSRASNGVVVVETVKPLPGEVRLSYTTDMNMDIADLSSYNMMNSSEILEFEKLSGAYQSDIAQPEFQYTHWDPLYNKRLQQVQSGIDSYWLKDPIRTGFAHRHSLYAEGGSENLVFNIGGNYKKNNAVMKNSGREEWGGRLNLTYRKDKLSVNNNLSIQGYKADESNYGSFSTWVNTKPYFEKYDSSEKYLEYIKGDGLTSIETIIPNPLYNAGLNSFDGQKNWGITNNLQLIYELDQSWRFQASMQVNKEATDFAAFVSPLDSQFDKVSSLIKGRYDSKKRDQFSYTANAMATYSKTFNKQTFTGNLRLEVAENNNTLLGFTAVGFPLSSDGNPAFAYAYEPNKSPKSSKSVSRRNSIISAFNYSYDNRYNVDASFNYDGSTSFGRANSYSPFFSLGGSWNMHRESFLKDNPHVNLLRLRANYGVTGNQNFNSTTSISTYNYMSAYSYFGQGVALATFGNENLKWQKTNQLSAGIDATLFENRFNLTINAYRKKTNDLAVPADLPASTGLLSYPFNAGDLTVEGFELTAKYNVIHRPQDRFVWNIGITGAKSKQTYNNFNTILEGLNASLQNSKSLERYRDGYSPNDLWAVRSLGIDPATGREIFMKKDGSQTFDYDAKDIKAMGNGNPRLQGVLSTNLNYKGFTLSAYLRYIWDQDIMNTALFNKVENISRTDITQFNQDKRALYDRWKQPGDIAQFRAISFTDVTPISSRFIQQENSLSLESLSLAYDFRDYAWINKLGLSGLRISGITNEVFRWSTVRRERGIDYPYAKSYSLTINARF